MCSFTKVGWTLLLGQCLLNEMLQHWRRPWTPVTNHWPYTCLDGPSSFSSPSRVATSWFRRRKSGFGSRDRQAAWSSRVMFGRLLDICEKHRKTRSIEEINGCKGSKWIIRS
jgi:hypothetical protein